MKEKSRRSRRKDPGQALLSAVMAFYFLGFFQLGIKDGNWQSFLLSLLVPVIIFIGTAGIPRLFPADKLLLSLTNFLCALGVLVQYRLNPGRGLTQAMNYGVGVGCMLLCTLLLRYWKRWGCLLEKEKLIRAIWFCMMNSGEKRYMTKQQNYFTPNLMI